MLQFEYQMSYMAYVPHNPGATNSDNGHYEKRLRKIFLTVLETFEHHYTGDEMCRIRLEEVLDNSPVAREHIVTYDAVLDMWEKSKRGEVVR